MECDTFVSEQFEVESDKVRSHGCRRLNAPVLLRREKMKDAKNPKRIPTLIPARAQSLASEKPA